MSSAALPPQPQSKPEGNGGSRESSEFEFVNVGQKTNTSHAPPSGQQSSINPLLMTSNHPPSGHGPGLVSAPRPTVTPSSSSSSTAAALLSPVSSTPSVPVSNSSMSQMSQSVSVPAKMDQTNVATVVAESPPTPGMFGWVKGSGFLSKVVEKTRTVTENVITTLDPQMKEYIHSGGDIEVVVASDKEDKVLPIRDAFQQVFGKATVYGLPSKCVSIAEQPVGFASGKQAALERVNSLRKSGAVGQETVVVSVENFLYEVNEDIWIDLSCLVLSDPLRKISLQSFSQPTNIAAGLVERLKEGTPDNYPKQWSGFAVTIGQVMGEELNVPNSSWQEAVSGLHRRRLLEVAGLGLAGMYRRSLQAKVEDI